MHGRFHMVMSGLIISAAMAALALTAGPAYAQPAAASWYQHRVTYVVRADIDGHSRLTLSGNSARWFHMDFAAPGRHVGKNEPTIINGRSWYPIWPAPGENTDCQCYSNTFRKVMPPVPQKTVSFSYKAVSCRDSCSVMYSHGALVIDFNDNPSASDAWYEVKISLTVKDLHA